MYARMTMRPALALVLAFLASACQQPSGVGQPSPAATGQTSPVAVTVAPIPTPSPTPVPTPTPRPEPQVAQCGQKIEKSFVLANDLTCKGDALVVVADGITLDLNGKLLTGPGMGPQTWPAPQLESIGVRVEGRRDVTVRNGRITDFSMGVYFVKVTASLIEEITSSRSRYGIYIHQADGNTVKRSKVDRNIYGLHLQEANDTLIQGNDLVSQTYNSPGGYGIYLYASRRNRITENNIENNVNWGIWFSEARGNLIFHNNVAGNRPQVADSSAENQWFDAEKKQGNFWGDHQGRDGDGDGIADTPYPILGAGATVDPYPFVKRDGWKTKTVGTVDHFRPPAPRSRVDVRIVALAGGSVVAASPRDQEAAFLGARASSIALSNDARTVYALDGRSLVAVDAVSGGAADPIAVQVDATRVAANRDGRSAFLVGPTGAEQVDVRGGTSRTRFVYYGAPSGIAASYKHNQMFIGTYDGIDMLYVQTGRSGTIYSRGGHVPYTIPLSGAPVAMAMNGSGTRIYAATAGTDVVQVVDTEQLVVVDRFRVGALATSLAVDARESRLYAGTADGVIAVDLPSRRALARTPLPGRAVDLGVSPNGDEIYVALAGARLGIAVLSAETLEVLHVIDLAAPPERLVVASI